MSTTIITRNVRLSFDKNLFEPKEAPEGKKVGKRTCNVICSADTTYAKMVDGKKVAITREGLKEIVEAEMKAKFHKVPAKYEDWATRKNDEANSQQTGERFKGYEDDSQIYFSPSRYEDQGFPIFVRRDGSVINPETADGMAECKRLFYAGAFVSAKMNIAAFEVNEKGVTKRGATSYLEALQFLKDGERFSGGSANAEGFDAEEEDEDDDI